MPTQFANPFHATTGFLDRYNVAAFFGETGYGFWHDVHATASWDIIKHDRQRRRAGDCLEMAIKAFLARLVIIRSNEQRRVHSEFLGKLCVGSSMFRGV